MARKSRSTRTKGNQYEREARELFIDLDYTVWPNKALTTVRFIGKGRYTSQDQDVFGCIDFIAMNMGKMVFVQVKTMTGEGKDHSHPTRARKAIDELEWPVCSHLEFVVLARIPKKPHNFRIWQKIGGGHDTWSKAGYLDGKVILKRQAKGDYLDYVEGWV